MKGMGPIERNLSRLGRFWYVFLIFTLVFSSESLAQNAEEGKMLLSPICGVYITGIGCSNCAKIDPILLSETTGKNPNVVVFEYEIYKSKNANKAVMDAYFQSYLPDGRTGIPFLVFNKQQNALGRNKVADLINEIGTFTGNDFPTPDANRVDWANLDITRLPGEVKIWTKNRVLMGGKGGDNALLKNILLADDVVSILKSVSFHRVQPIPVEISLAEIPFQQAVMIGSWRLQWNGPEAPVPHKKGSNELWTSLLLLALLVMAIAFSFFRLSLRKSSKGSLVKFEIRGRIRDLVIVTVSLTALILFFVAAKNISMDFLEKRGYQMPLPLFTLLIGALDGVNPCNMFVLTCLLAILISSSDSRKKIYIVGLSFVVVVFLFYFMFMALWLNIFKYISFIKPLRIGIAILSLIAGIINCKELFFFKKGISLTIPEQQKGPLMKRLQAMKDVVKEGSTSLLIASSIGLAILSSLVEIPCTAGFPIIYTGILVGKGFDKNIIYYLYLIFYNILYVLPLALIVGIFVYTLKARQINQRQMEVIKYIGGIIMILLGIVLLINPGLLGLGMGS